MKRRETFTSVSNAVLDADLDPYELAVYMAIARQDFAGHGGREPLSQPELMGHAHVKDRRGIEALNALRRRGLVVAEDSGGHRFIYKRAENADPKRVKPAPDTEIKRRKSAPRAEKTAKKTPKTLQDMQPGSAPRAGMTARGAEPSLLRTKDAKDDTTADAVDALPRPAAALPPTAQNKRRARVTPKPSEPKPDYEPAHDDAARVAEVWLCCDGHPPQTRHPDTARDYLLRADAVLSRGLPADDVIPCIRYVASERKKSGGRWFQLTERILLDRIERWRQLPGKPTTYQEPSKPARSSGHRRPPDEEHRDAALFEERKAHFAAKRGGNLVGWDSYDPPPRQN